MHMLSFRNFIHVTQNMKLPYTAIALLFLLVLCVVVWGRTVEYDFVWDDEYFIVSNPAIRSAIFIPRYFTDVSTVAGKGYANKFCIFRPLRNISYLIDFKLAGLNARWWHWHNLLIHLVNSTLIFLIAKKLFKNQLVSMFGSALFLLHPVQSEVVAWVKCRDDLLACLFILIAFFLWLKWRTHLFRIGRLIIIAILYFLACLSKVQAIIFPLILIVYEYWIGSQKYKKIIDNKNIFLTQIKKVTFYLFIVGLVYLTWRHLFLGRTTQTCYLAGSFLPTMLTMTKVGVKYITLLIYPSELFADYLWIEPLRSLGDWRVWTNGVFLVIFVGCLFASRRRWPVASFGLMWFVIFLLPLSNVVPTMQYMAERFMYLPLAGFVIGATSILWRMAQRKWQLAMLIAFLVLTACGIKSSERVEVWRDNLTLFTATVDDTSANATRRSRRSLMISLINRGEYEKALPIIQQLLKEGREEKVLSKRSEAKYICDQGFIFVKTGRPKIGTELLLSAITIDPLYTRPYLILGTLEGNAGNHTGALKWFYRAIEKDATDGEVYYNMGISLRELGQKQEAEEAFRKAIANGNENIEVYKSLGALLWHQKRFKEAILLYREAIRIHPNDSEIRDFLNEIKRN